MPEIQKVSHSEAEAYLSCRRKHFYGYVKNGGLKPNVVSKGLSRGSFVHAVLEVYYNVILEAGDTNKEQRGARQAATKAARAFYEEQIASGEAEDEPQTGRRTVNEMLFDFYFPNENIVSAGWTVQAVEYAVALHMELDENTTYEYPFVVDLIALDPEGRTVVIDHKCVYDFYSSEDVDLLSQLPKYLAALRAGEFPADYAAYNMIRNRSKKDPVVEDVMRFLAVKPTTHTVEQVFLEQISVASDIIHARTLEEKEADHLAFRSASTITCRNCDFRDLCVSERVGSDISPALAIDFTVRTNKPFEADVTIN